MLCSPVLDSTLVFHEDLVVNGVGVEPTYTIIYDEYVWESEEEPAMKDDLLLSAPHLIFPNIFFILPLLIFHVITHSRMHLLLIIHRIHGMSFCHCVPERKPIFFQIYSVFHPSFLKMQRVNILSYHQPLYMIHQIMSMPMNIPNYLIVVVVITFLLHSIKMLIHFQ